ncbi:MAG: ester cyclase [Haliscomenobacter sp.]|uniref:ester cyclase n=1 Tax=Haliscomenobacter sp. TaxID=2717303 RepID=UPI0029A3E6A2|nr:ester cyclase [Haliscomenobacter sp.]MDX2070320.1 ester cyclase [Haliscomenobacter sp.]
MTEKHKEIARFISQKVVNEKDYTPIDEYLTDDYVYHGLGGMTAHTPQGFKVAIAGFHAAIPDLKSEILDMVAEGDRLVLRFHFTGTHQGEFLGFPASGARLHFEGMIMCRFVDGKVAEDWDYFDFPTVVAQIQSQLKS